ncbi:single-stranded DNA-binding protein [Lactiplantibacillus plantarum]|uniref:single-stranded DNA-binding protein n=1 Tax=Lactiplantibacillus plantarum TaxID=1590 RepID=UPI001E2A5CFF|nr:single-stranded DNA-binding protein [Lactiplantibacillus plantarum]MCC6117624.1 single-stranded DNA-binding protein [Lactiplantibacillus plantarum]MCW6115171.1 single-stranded DNA-binding protein [Lactiplantibacillus plantarum]
MRQITISGNLGKNPEVRQTQSGMQVANFSLAVRQNRPDDQGNYGTDWFRCAVWGKRAGTIERYFHKGNHVTVTGTLEVDEYNGQTQLGVNVTDFDLPDRESNQSKSQSNNQASHQQPVPSAGGQIDITDNLPF